MKNTITNYKIKEKPSEELERRAITEKEEGPTASNVTQTWAKEEKYLFSEAKKQN